MRRFAFQNSTDTKGEGFLFARASPVKAAVPKTRTAPPDPPSNLMGATTRNAPVSGQCAQVGEILELVQSRPQHRPMHRKIFQKLRNQHSSCRSLVR